MSYGCAVLMGAGRYVVNGPVCGHITGGNMKIATIIIVVLVNAHMVLMRLGQLLNTNTKNTKSLFLKKTNVQGVQNLLDRKPINASPTDM